MKCSGKWVIGYGVFLFVCGLAGYLSNPEQAQTALMSGSVFGGLSLLWGVLMLLGQSWARMAALVTTGLLSVVFIWRSTVSWMAVAEGDAKLFAASLITLMLLGSVATVVFLVKSRTRKAEPAPAKVAA